MSGDSLTRALDAARKRVTYRLTYDVTEPRDVYLGGIDGPDLPNAYWYMQGDKPDRSRTGSGEWCDPDHPSSDDPQDHIDRWFTVAIREAVHEALEWFWVDGEQYLNPHGIDEATIHDLSGEFAESLLRLRHGANR
jgi:hypothetical protein